jgi:hypothetical protein
MGNSPPRKGIALPSNLFLLEDSKTHLLDFACVQNKKKGFSELVKNKPHIGISKTCIYFWYTGSHGSEQL